MTTPQSIFQGLAKDQTAQDIKAAIDALATASDADQAASLAKLEELRALLGAPIAVTSQSLANIDTDLGAPADAPATSDTGSFSLTAFVKRALQNWSTLQAKIPALGGAARSASIPVSLSDGLYLSVTGKSAVHDNLMTGTHGAGEWFDALGYNSGSISLTPSGTLSAGAWIFEQTNDPSTPGETYPLNATAGSDQPSMAFGQSLTTGNKTYSFSIHCRYIRARIYTATVGGTVSAYTTLSQAQYGHSNVAVAQPTAANLQVTANAPTKLVVNGTAQTFAINVDMLTGNATSGANSWTDAGAYSSCYLQVVGNTGLTTGGFIVECTNDISSPASGVPVPVDLIWTPASKGAIAGVGVSAGANIIAAFHVPARYIRVRTNLAAVGGTMRAFATFSQQPYIPATMAVVQSAASNLQTITFPAGNNPSSVEASSAKTVTGVGATQANAYCRGAHFLVNVSAMSGTPTLAVKIQMQDSVSGNWVDIPGAVTASITATGTYVLTLYPGISEVANSEVSIGVPRTFRAAWTIGGASPSITFSISAAWIY